MSQHWTQNEKVKGKKEEEEEEEEETDANFGDDFLDRDSANIDTRASDQAPQHFQTEPRKFRYLQLITTNGLLLFLSMHFQN
jgi:hypothetical protein